MFWVVVAVLYVVLAAVAPSILGLFVNRARPDFRTLSLSLRIAFVLIALICLAATSYVHVESDERRSQRDLRNRMTVRRAHRCDQRGKGSAGRNSNARLASL